MIFSSRALRFPHPEPLSPRGRIYPVFLPFSGCRQRCLFCAQDAQTGRDAADGPGAVEKILESVEQDLLDRTRQGKAPVELAFYGGTFTALPDRDLRLCLDFAARWKDRGAVTALRCSTRPDAVLSGEAALLRSAGFSLVELGVQSYADTALSRSRRGYTGRMALEACRAVQEVGLNLGVQLMPGLPGQSPGQAWEDVEAAIACAPACVRLYPCLVLEGTDLAALWRAGAYSPWDDAVCFDFLARACLAFWDQGIPVIRMGLAQGPDLARIILAGPRHPALGGLVRGRALLRRISEQARNLAPGVPLRVTAPRSAQGFFWGHGKELEQAYARLGIHKSRVAWQDEPEIILEEME